MKSLRISSSTRLSLIVAVVTIGLGTTTEGATSEDESPLPRSVADTAESPSSSPPLSPLTADGGGAGDDVSNNEQKLLFECRHPDYRTYIKCLKRQKRHHRQHQQRNEHETSEGGEPRRCFDECGLDECESTSCVHDCHKRCMKKTKETRQIITQYETTCLDGSESDDCKTDRGKVPATTNVTTNIDINNVINNHRDGSQVPCNGGPFGCDNRFPFGPQLQLVPQITFGLGIGYGTNFQQGGAGVGARRIDCSPCGNPLMRYRCDVSCYPIQDSPNVPIPASEGANAGASNCVAPYCVGGT